MNPAIPVPTIDIELAVFTFFEGRFSVLLHDIAEPGFLPRRTHSGLGLPMKRWINEPSLSHCLVFLTHHPALSRGMHPVFFEYLEPMDRRGIVLRYYLCAEVEPDRLPKGFYLFPALQNPLDLASAITRLQTDLENMPLVPWMLGSKFTLSQVQEATEVILRRPLDKRHFRRQVMETGWLQDVGIKTKGGAHRPASLYSLSSPEDWERNRRLLRKHTLETIEPFGAPKRLPEA